MKILRHSTFLALTIILTSVFSHAGNPEWVEVRSRHFVVITDDGEKQGRQVALRFEQMRSAFGTLFGKMNVNVPVPLQIVAFRSGKELKQFSPIWKGKPVQLAGFFQPGEDRNFIALDLSAENGWSTVFHEYAHLLINANLPPTPAWFDEGYAEYFSTLKVSGKDLEFGTVPAGSAQILNDTTWMKSVNLFSVGHDSKEYNESGSLRSLFYAQSWITVHYLMVQHKTKQLALYLDLTEKSHVPVPEAIQQAFQMSPDQFDKTLYRYFHGTSSYFRAPAPPDIDAGPYQVRALDAVERDAELADLKFHCRDHQEEGIADFKKILEQQPDNMLANRGLGYAYLRKRDFDSAAPYLKRASAGGSKDARLHFFNAMLVSRSSSGMVTVSSEHAEEVRSELLKSIELDPTFADAYNLLAVTEASSGNHVDAIRYARKALELNPRNEFYTFNLANYEMQAQQWDEAKQLLTTLASSSNQMIATMAQQNLGHLQDMQRWRQGKGAVVSSLESGDVPPSKEAESIQAQPPNVSIAFLKGRLLSVDCSIEPTAMLEVKVGVKTWHMRAKDRTKLVVIGADQLSCAWKNKPVAVNYREIGDGAGDLVSLEIQ